MKTISKEELIGSEIIGIAYYEENKGEIGPYIMVKTKNGKIIMIGATSRETLFVAEDGGNDDR